MRDGIYKSLPIPTWWKGVMRCCERKAERGETLVHAAARATEKDARQEITPQFLKQLHEMCALDKSSLPGFGQLHNVRDVRELGGMNTPLENDLLGRAKFLEKSGYQGTELITEALAQVLIARQKSIFAQAQPLYLQEAGKEARSFLAALRGAQEKTLVHDIAERAVRGERKPIARMRRAVDVDFDDLSAPV